MSQPLLAFHNDPAIRKKYIARVLAHQRADEIVQGIGYDTSTHRGCAVGCTLDSYDHNRYPIELGIPILLARLQDRIHEGLPLAEAKKWPLRFLRAIPQGADLSEVWPKFAIWLLRDVRKYARPDGKKAIDGVVRYFRLPPVERTAAKLKAVRSAAYAAYAAYAAAYAYAASASAAAAAYAAAYADAYADAASASSAAYAAYAAAYAYAASASAAAAARCGHYKRQSKKLLELLSAA